MCINTTLRIYIASAFMPAFWGAVSLITLSSVPLASLLVIQRIVEDQARSSAVTSRQAASPGSNDNGMPARTSYAVVSLLCMLVMAALFGTSNTDFGTISITT